MSISDEIKAAMTGNAALMAVLTGGVHNDVEEISRQNTPTAFDAITKELRPCALIKLGTEVPLRSGYPTAVQTPVTIYFYQRQGYSSIEDAMEQTFTLLNDTRTGTNVWRIEYDASFWQQRDTALDCALGYLRFVAKRLR